MANGNGNGLTSALAPIAPPDNDGATSLSISPDIDPITGSSISPDLYINPLAPRAASTATVPTTGPSANFDLAFGDSVAALQHNHGMWGNTGPQYNSRNPAPFNIWDTSGVGDPPSRVLARINYMLQQNPQYFAGKNIFLSPGTSNNPTQMDQINSILSTLKGANAASVVVPGIGPGIGGKVGGQDPNEVNKTLQTTVEGANAEDGTGTRFRYFYPNMSRGWDSAQGVHPNAPTEMTAQALAALNARQAGTAAPTVGAPTVGAPTVAPTTAATTGEEGPSYFATNPRNPLLAPQTQYTPAAQGWSGLRVGLPTSGSPNIPYTTYGGTAAGQQQARDLDLLNRTIYERESSSGRNISTSSAGAVGPMQIIPSTWDQYAKPGENINNYQDNMRVGQRIIADLYQRYNGNMDAVLIGYNAGEKRIGLPWDRLPSETQAYIKNSHRDWGYEQPTAYTPYSGQPGERVGLPPMVSGQTVPGTNYGMGSPLAFAPPRPVMTGPTAPGGPSVQPEGGNVNQAGGPGGETDPRISAIEKAFADKIGNQGQMGRGYQMLALLSAMNAGHRVVPASGYNPAAAVPRVMSRETPMDARPEPGYAMGRVPGRLWY